MMNKIYYFYDETDSENRAVYIAHANYKSARLLALANMDGTFDFSDNLIINLRGHMCREKDNPILTDKLGQLNVRDLAELKLLWFTCGECDCNDQKHKCRKPLNLFMGIGI